MIELSKDKLSKMFLDMTRIRVFEETLIQVAREGLTRGPLHVYIGEEAVAVGVCSNLEKDDYITSTHRGHGHCIAKGGDPKLMMAELLGREEGYCKGRGGSMHLADLEHGLLRCSGIVAGGIPIAIGAGFSAQYRQSGQVTVAFFGDGASNEGACHEAMNLAAVWKLPVVFLCENNLYGISCPTSKSLPIKDVADRAAAYGIPGDVADGMDVLSVYEAAKKAVEHVRSGKGPYLLECKTYRFEGHWIGDPVPYRTKEEVEEWKKADAIVRFKKHLIDQGVLTPSEIERLEAGVAEEMSAAVAFAKAGTVPLAESNTEYTYA